MIILMGKSATGKTSIAKALKKRGFAINPTVTTRPMRDGEEDGEDYFFVTNEKFREYIDAGVLAEYREYPTAHGTWYYGSLKADLMFGSMKDVIILTPDGVKNAKKNLCDVDNKIITVLIDSPRNVRTQRLDKRGDDVSEVIRRLEADDLDFDGAEDLADYVVVNDGSKSIAELADEIVDIAFKENRDE